MSVNEPAAAVTIYGKPDCSKCLACKARLTSLNVPFQFIDLTLGPSEPIDQFLDAYAAYSDWEDLPVCVYHGSCYTYPELIQRIKTCGGC